MWTGAREEGLPDKRCAATATTEILKQKQVGKNAPQPLPLPHSFWCWIQQEARVTESPDDAVHKVMFTASLLLPEKDRTEQKIENLIKFKYGSSRKKE